MIILECDQGSDEWLAARAGVITASMFVVARKKVNCLTEQQSKYVNAIRAGLSDKEAMLSAGYKAKPKTESIERAIAGEKVGEFSDAAKDYAFRLAMERIGGKPLDEGFETWSMRRGHDLEPAARRAHEAQTGLIVQRAGFVVTDDYAFGASADGLIEGDGGSEYKCFVDPTKLRSILIDRDWSTLTDQVQGCLWLTGRKWWHQCLYCPALEPVGKELTWLHVTRDENYIEKMEVDLLEFKALVDSTEAILRLQDECSATENKSILKEAA
jgi:hypothetical protein